MNDHLNIIYWAIFAFIAGNAVGVSIMYRLRSNTSTTTNRPQVIVNLPSDFRPMSGLPPTQIEGARAVLYWTVLDRIWDDCATVQAATDGAKAAVEAVFGPSQGS